MNLSLKDLLLGIASSAIPWWGYLLLLFLEIAVFWSADYQRTRAGRIVLRLGSILLPLGMALLAVPHWPYLAASVKVLGIGLALWLLVDTGIRFPRRTLIFITSVCLVTAVATHWQFICKVLRLIPWLQFGIGFGVFLAVGICWGLVDGRITVDQKIYRRTKRSDSDEPSPDANLDEDELAKHYYIAGKSQSEDGLGESDDSGTFSISFVEYDARGDFWEQKQYEDACRMAQKLAEQGPLRLVIYCHGWQNNAQSEDVLKFANFLRQMCNVGEKGDSKKRVHGIYLGWCGSVYRPEVHLGDFKKVLKGIHKERSIVKAKDLEHPKPWISWARLATYWGRKSCAESETCGVPMAATIFRTATLARAAGLKRDSEKGGGIEVVAMGHSFGALMLEKTIGQACVSAMTAAGAGWNRADDWWPLPFDLVLLVNSAAPSIYAKMLKEFMECKEASTASNPIVISLTSNEDAATGIAHPIGNMLAHLSGNLKRMAPYAKGPTQADYYKRTPGHNPWLLDYWIGLGEGDSISVKRTKIGKLIDKCSPVESPTVTTNSRIRSFLAPTYYVSRYQELDPSRESRYLILRCGRELITGHNDIWTEQAKRLYTDLLRFAIAERAMKPPAEQP